MPPRYWAAFFVLALVGCASGPPATPYAAYRQADDLANTFLASLPGVYAKQLSGDLKMRNMSSRIDLPPGWQGTTGGEPGKLLEIVVLDGDLTIGDVRLSSGGYVYVPPGSIGFNLVTDNGARVLYYLDDVDPLAMIQSPIILDARLVDWQPTDTSGIETKELRNDPGNGARTWLLRVSPGASIPWQASTADREGYLVTGEYQHSECVFGEVLTGAYTAGGYFNRPANTLNGGPESFATTESIWVLRERSVGVDRIADSCR
jgi:hypothetical protein